MNQPERGRLVEWLLDHAGPVVRYRTTAELVGEQPSAESAEALLQDPTVQTWLSRLGPGEFHGNKATCTENVLGKLCELGLNSRMTSFAESAKAYLEELPGRSHPWLQGRVSEEEWERLFATVRAGFLARCGFRDEAGVQDFMSGYLPALAKTAEDNVFDIYADASDLEGLPARWVGKPILKPSLVRSYYLIKTYDLFALAPFAATATGSQQSQLNQIARYVLRDEVQAFEPGYGYHWDKGDGYCYAWGYSPDLPGHNGFGSEEPEGARALVQRLEWMSGFGAARESRWFTSAVKHLETFRTDSGTYVFPASYLQEKQSGYYIHGDRMGLGESRRKKEGLEVESTFRMLKILTPGMGDRRP